MHMMLQRAKPKRNHALHPSVCQTESTREDEKYPGRPERDRIVQHSAAICVHCATVTSDCVTVVRVHSFRSAVWFKDTLLSCRSFFPSALTAAK